MFELIFPTVNSTTIGPSSEQPEERLWHGSETYFNLVQKAPFGIYVIDSNFRLIQISQGAEKVFSQINPLIGRDFAEILQILWQEPHASEFIGRFRHTLATGEHYHSQDTTGQHNNVDDEESYDWKIERITLPDGQFGVVCYFYDLTERQQFEAKLRESEERMSVVLRSAKVGVMILDLHDQQTYRSPEYFAIFGAEESDNTANGFRHFVHPDDLEGVLRQYEDAVEHGIPYAAEFRIITNEGKTRWIGNLGNAEVGEDGKPARFFNTIFDITERKQRELNQVFVAELARVLYNETDPDQIMRIACSSIGEYLNTANCTLAEVDTERNTAVLDYVWCRDDRAADFSGIYDLDEFVTDSYRNALIAGRSVIVENVTKSEITAGFSEKFTDLGIYSFVNTPFLNDGRLKYLLNVYDSSERIWLPWEIELLEQLVARTRLRIEKSRAIQGLRESEERLRLIVESVPDYAIITTNAAGIINGWNPAAQSIFGYTQDEVIGDHLSFLYNSDDVSAKVPESQIDLAASVGRAPDDRWLVRKNGSTFFASGTISKFEANGESGFVKIVQDLTLKMRAEKSQRQQELLENIVRSQEAERHRIARDLHDHLGQRITGLRFAIDGLKTYENDGEGQRAQIDKITELALQIDRDASKIAFELRPPVIDDFGFEKALDSYLNEWSGNSGIDAEFHFLNTHQDCLGPDVETNLFRIVQEALNNAAKHSNARRVGVVIETRGNDLVLIIEDDGSGYDPKAAVTPDANGKGGFGLIGMRERAAIIGGTLEVETAQDRGTSIFITIPLR